MNRQEIRREVEKRVSSYSDEEIFSSSAFAQMLLGSVEAMCAKEGRLPNITTEYTPGDDTTAYTDGLNIHINTASPLIYQMSDGWMKYLGCIGHAVHEAGHILYTDFTILNPLRESWVEGPFHFWPKAPNIKDAKKVEAYLSAHENMRQVYGGAMNDLVNIMEDIYIENRIYQNFAGLASAGIRKVNDEGYRLSAPFDKVASKMIEGEILPIHVFNYLIHLIYNGYQPVNRAPLDEKQQKVKKIMEISLQMADKHLKKLAVETDGRERARLFNELFVMLFPLMPQLDDQSNDQQQMAEAMEQFDCRNAMNGKSNQHMDYDDALTQALADNAEQLMEQCFISNAPEGDTAPVDNQAINSDEVDSNKENAASLAENESSIQREYQQMLYDLAHIEVLEQDEQEHENALKKEAQQIHNEYRGKTCGISGFSLIRPKGDESEYDYIHKETQEVSRILIRKLKNMLKIREVDDYETGYRMGNRFNVKAAVHKEEGRCFKKKNQPSGQSKVVFSILVDESGSMSAKCYKVCKVAILLEEVLRSLDIPLMIVGHTTEGSSNHVVLRSYVDFDSNDNRDRYRLAEISSYDCNIDGAAIAYCTSKLLKRDEDIKVLIVISDGKPCGGSYFSKDRDEDTRLAVNAARKKGIRVFGAFLNDFEGISKLYGSQYAFDCSDYNTLQQQFIMLIKRYIRQTLI